MNFSSKNLEAYFINDDYIIETVKSIGVFNPDAWLEAFKKPLTKNIVEAKILHTSTGLTLPIKRHSRSQTKQTLEFAGLHSYNEKSKLLSELLSSLLEHIQNEQVTRLDVAIDFKGKIPNRVIKKLCEDRDPLRRWNTTYYKSKSEKKQNYYMNIKTYSKSNKEKLREEINRLEFVFMRDYLKKVQVKDIEKSFKRIAKSIKKFSGLDVQISYL
ncbi:hypothetical protein MLC52_09765 [Sulfurimonas sp. NW15]|uniref:hypothetical protein n=1 Tax=Sulfurimonas TaxID=202746 RepID=UPI00125F5E92|nr:hypothetical protein [Sulfurimonas hydrogeniphila]